ncbi:uncharacterized protein LOC131234508 isoform X2 [Magnolia sinica]|uniref:uncharacterized protein LOC131234508 isoform X2 n=1 Tax=Magnolia sinica TaxID=86752 RepID=UPI002658F983|nr:uncharacterized protein LOC131234508 isoform X2 [Magnolia sinica]
MEKDFSEMDFHSMKRKELQSLCKKHNLPSTSTNQAMVFALSSLLKVKTGGSSRLKRSPKAAVAIPNYIKLKKVRFEASPRNRIGRNSPRSRDTARRASTIKPAAEVNDMKSKGSGITDEIGAVTVRTTRSRAGQSSESARVAISPLVKKKTLKRAKAEIDVVETVRNVDVIVTGDRVPVTRSLRSRKVFVVEENPKSKNPVGLDQKSPIKTRKRAASEDGFPNNLVQTRSRKQGNDNPVHGEKIMTETRAGKKGSIQSKQNAPARNEMVTEKSPELKSSGGRDVDSRKYIKSPRKTRSMVGSESLKRSRGLDVSDRKYDKSPRKTRSTVVIESLKKDEEVGGEVGPPKNSIRTRSKKQISSQGLDVNVQGYYKSPRKTRGTSVSESLKTDGEVVREVGPSKKSRWTRSLKRENDNKTESGKGILVSDEIHGRRRKMISTLKEADDKVATRSKRKAPKLDGMVGTVDRPSKRSSKKRVLAEVAPVYDDRNGMQTGAADVPNKKIKVSHSEEPPRRQSGRNTSKRKISPRSSSKTGMDETTGMSGRRKRSRDPVMEELASVYEDRTRLKSGFKEYSRKSRRGTARHAVRAPNDDKKTTTDEIVGKKMTNKVRRRGEFGKAVIHKGSKTSKTPTSKISLGRKSRKVAGKPPVPVCENVAEVETELVPPDAELSAAEPVECNVKAVPSLSRQTPDFAKEKTRASGRKSSRKDRSGHAYKERRSDEPSREVATIPSDLTKIDELPECNVVVSMCENQLADDTNKEMKDALGDLPIAKEMADKQFGGEQVSEAGKSISPHVTPVITLGDGFGHHENENEILSEEILQAVKDDLASGSHKKGQNSFGLKNMVSVANEMAISKVIEVTDETAETAKGLDCGVAEVVVVKGTTEGVLVCHEASSNQGVDVGAVAVTVSDVTEAARGTTGTVPLDLVPVDAVEIIDVKVSKCDVGTEGFTPARDASNIIQINCEGIPEPAETPEVNEMVTADRTSCAKGLPPIQAMGYKDEEPSSTQLVDSEDFDLTKTLTVPKEGGVENQEGSNHKYPEQFVGADGCAETVTHKHVLDEDTEIFEKNGVTQTHSEQIDTEDVDRNETKNKNIEAASEELEERVTHEHVLDEDKEISEKNGVAQTHSEQIDVEDVDRNEAKNKNIEAASEKLEERVTLELGFEDHDERSHGNGITKTISEEHDTNCSEERLGANEIGNVALQESKEAAETSVKDPADQDSQGVEPKGNSEENAEDRNIETIEKPVGHGDGDEPVDEKENPGMLVDKYHSEFEQVVATCMESGGPLELGEAVEMGVETIDNEDVGGNDVSNKNIEDASEKLEERVMLELGSEVHDELSYANGIAKTISEEGDPIGSEERLDADEISNVVLEESKVAAETIVKDPEADCEGVELNGSSKQNAEEESNMETMEEAVGHGDDIKPVDEKGNPGILMDKYESEFEQSVAAAQMESEEPSLQQTVEMGIESVASGPSAPLPIDALDSKDSPPRNDKDFDSSIEQVTSAERQEEGINPEVNVGVAAEKIASIESNLFCGHNVDMDTRNSMYETMIEADVGVDASNTIGETANDSEFVGEEFHVSGAAATTLAVARENEVESLLEEYGEASYLVKTLEGEAEAPDRYVWEEFDGEAWEEISEGRGYDESIQQVASGVGSEENVVKHMVKFDYECNTKELIGVEEETYFDLQVEIDQNQNAKTLEERLNSEVCEEAEAKETADARTEKSNCQERVEQAPVKSEEPSAAREVKETASGMSFEEESTFEEKLSYDKHEEG